MTKTDVPPKPARRLKHPYPSEIAACALLPDHPPLNQMTGPDTYRQNQYAVNRSLTTKRYVSKVQHGISVAMANEACIQDTIGRKEITETTTLR